MTVHPGRVAELREEVGLADHAERQRRRGTRPGHRASER